MKRVLGVLGIAALVTGGLIAAGGDGEAVADDEVQASLVEDFVYPGADEVLARTGLEVFTGDGNVEPVSSGSDRCGVGLVEVEAFVGEEMVHTFFCFRTTGARGFLTMLLPSTFAVRAGSKPVEATASLPDGEKETYKVPTNTVVPIEPGTGDAPVSAILVELRFGQW